MSGIAKIVDRRLWPLWLTLLGALILFGRLGSFGFWEPHEMAVADQARTLSDVGQPAASVESVDDGNSEGDVDSAKPKPKPKTKAAKARPADHPSFSVRSAAKGIELFGVSELGARLPFAACGLLILLLTYLLGFRAGGHRAGLVAGLALVSIPLFLFQSRQLNSDIGVSLGQLALVVGALGLAWPRSTGSAIDIAWRGLDGLLIAGGAWLALAAGGGLFGLFVPLASIACAGIGLFLARRSEDGDPVPRPTWVVVSVATVAAIGVLTWVLWATFDLLPPKEGDFAVFGVTAVPAAGYIDALGGVWKANGSLEVTFNGLFEQIAFGAMPWVVVAPFAVGRLAIVKRIDRKRLIGLAIFAWAVTSWIAATVFTRKVGPVLYPALPALALGAGIWMDDIWQKRDDPRESTPVWPLVALFAGLAACVLGKDVTVFPERLAGIHITGVTQEFPEGVGLHRIVLVLSVAFAGAVGAGLALWRRSAAEFAFPPRLAAGLVAAGRYGLHAALVISVLGGLFFAQVWTPGLAAKLSSRDVFNVLRKLRQPTEELVVLGRHGSGPDFYAGGELTKINQRRELYDYLKKPERIFALVGKSDLCAIQGEGSQSDFKFHVLDNSHAKYLLLSNQLKGGEEDKNYLATRMGPTKPTTIKKSVDVNYEDKLQLIGVTMPDKVATGDTFEVSLYFKVLAPLRKNWSVFAHFDGGGQRFQGDHKPHETFCGTTQWRKGDYIVDTFEVTAGGLTFQKGTYKLWAGLFVGSAGNWTNMKVVSQEKDDNNRVLIGTIELN